MVRAVKRTSHSRIQWTSASKKNRAPHRQGPATEREGFEPSIRVSAYAGLANRCLQPLGHLSRRLATYCVGDSSSTSHDARAKKYATRRVSENRDKKCVATRAISSHSGT